MGKALTLFYDPVGDILVVERLPAYPEQVTRSIGDGILVRERPGDGVIESVEVWNFTRRAAEREGLSIPLIGEFRQEQGRPKRAIA